MLVGAEILQESGRSIWIKIELSPVCGAFFFKF